MYNVHNYDLVGYIRKFCQISSDADDIAQNTWLKLLNGMDDYDESKPFKPYLVGVARHAMYSYYRDLKRGRNESRLWKSDFIEYNRPEYWKYSTAPPVESESDRLTKYAVAVTLRKLTWQQRRRFRKHYWRGYTYKEICEEEGLVSIAAFMHRARKQFAKYHAEGSGTRLDSKPN